MGRCGQKNSAPLCAEPMSGSARSELIKLIRHRLHEPLGPTLLVLQLLLREESLSPQGVALIRMLQRSIKEEVRAIHELLTIIETFIQEPAQADSRQNSDMEESSQRSWRDCHSCFGLPKTLLEPSMPNVSIPSLLTARSRTDGGGFEPPVPFGTHAFQACTINHSVTHPEQSSASSES